MAEAQNQAAAQFGGDAMAQGITGGVN